MLKSCTSTPLRSAQTNLHARPCFLHTCTHHRIHNIIMPVIVLKLSYKAPYKIVLDPRHKLYVQIKIKFLEVTLAAFGTINYCKTPNTTLSSTLRIGARSIPHSKPAKLFDHTLTSCLHYDTVCTLKLSRSLCFPANGSANASHKRGATRAELRSRQRGGRLDRSSSPGSE